MAGRGRIMDEVGRGRRRPDRLVCRIGREPGDIDFVVICENTEGGALMLDHLGYPEAAAAIDSVLSSGDVRTPDLGGTHRTEDLGRVVADALGSA
ncbi:hypothetical protein [Actinoplanes sp. NPDC051851]|uniref:hypothetical protein n=1 Tax=Actinoplanes sp. NPDC051851 TaxID=3154753 RepID=UPI003424273D